MGIAVFGLAHTARWLTPSTGRDGERSRFSEFQRERDRAQAADVGGSGDRGVRTAQIDPRRSDDATAVEG